MLDRGDATVEDIDKSMELGAGHPMGPLTLAVSKQGLVRLVSSPTGLSMHYTSVMVILIKSSIDPLGRCAHGQDYIGLDTCLSILDGWTTTYPAEPTFVVPECLRRKVADGKLGRKSGEGFYVWSGDKRSVVAP